MPLKLDHIQIERPDRDPARRLHPIPRTNPCLEVLEPRCLMSGPQAKVWADGAVTAFVRDATAAIKSPHLDAPARSSVDLVAQGATRAGSGGTDAADPQDVQHASYVIVRETNAPHGTSASAQELPDVPYFGVIGTLGSEDSIDLYRMPIDAGTVGLQFELVSQQGSPGVPVQFWLFDGSGQAVGPWSSGDELRLELAGPLSGTTLFLGISATSLNSPGGPPPTINYQLWVTRLDATDLRPINTGGAAAPLATPAFPIVPVPLPTSAASLPPAMVPLRDDARATPAPIPTSPGAGWRLAVGSSATRSAAPSAGVMADGDPAPPSPRRRAATVGLEGMDRSLPTLNLDPGEGMSPRANFGREGVPKALVALRGPGGFPLLGAAAIGDWRRAPAAIPAISAEPPAPDGAAPPTADRLAGQDPPSVAAEPPAEADHPSEAIAPRTQSRGEYRVSLSSGLSLATVLTLNVVLSDPVAGFDYLASYFEERARESPHHRMDFRGKSPHRGQPD